MRSAWPWLAAAGVAVVALCIFLADRFPGALDDPDNRRRAVYFGLLLALVGGSLLVRLAQRPKAVLRQGTVWIAILLVLVLGYSYRDVLGDALARLRGELLPQEPVPVGESAVAVRAGNDGQFSVRATVDGQTILFIVDTGASDVVLSPADARRLGFDAAALSYTQLYHTANGVGRGAPVELRHVAIGPVELADVRASVNEAPMARSLLGMSFLGRLGGYEVRGDTLTLRR